MSVTVEIEGLDRWMEMCDPARFTDQMDKAVSHAADVLRDATKTMPPVNSKDTGFYAPGIPVAPVYGGTLRQSIVSRKTQLLAADIVAGAGYSGLVHDGVPAFELNRNVNIPGVGWRHIGLHPGMPARPFFKWVLEEFNGLQMIDVILKTALEWIVDV